MKFFNWMHRKFNPNVLKDGFAINVKKTESIAIDTNTKALLEQVALVDVLDGWKNGLLTIGTFGFDPLTHFDEHPDCVSSETEDDEVEDEQPPYSSSDGDDKADEDNVADQVEELNPLISGTFENDYGHHDGNFKGPDQIVAVTSAPCIGPTRETMLDGAGNEGLQMRRRKTLRDLFSEDSDNKNPNLKKEAEPANSGKKAAPAPPAKKPLLFTKKIIPAADDSRPLKKLNQMMKRMLKRKIHPELQGKPRKLEKENKISVGEANAAGKKLRPAESVSLLQTSGERV